MLNGWLHCCVKLSIFFLSFLHTEEQQTMFVLHLKCCCLWHLWLCVESGNSWWTVNTLTTCFSSSRFPVLVDGTFSALSRGTTDLLCWMGWCELKSRWLSVFVSLRYHPANSYGWYPLFWFSHFPPFGPPSRKSLFLLWSCLGRWKCFFSMVLKTVEDWSPQSAAPCRTDKANDMTKIGCWTLKLFTGLTKEILEVGNSYVEKDLNSHQTLGKMQDMLLFTGQEDASHYCSLSRWHFFLVVCFFVTSLDVSFLFSPNLLSGAIIRNGQRVTTKFPREHTLSTLSAGCLH